MLKASRPWRLFPTVLLCACSPAKDDGQAAPAAAQAAPSTDAAPGPLAKFRPSDVKLDHKVETLDGRDVSLADYRGKALLVVNTASQCGFTPQYKGLQELYAEYSDKGLEVLAFPSNDFGAQEPGSNDEIRSFVDENFEVTFTLFDKVTAKGADKSPLYRTLTEETGEGIKGEVGWNFTKFLVAPDGRVVARFDSSVDPMDDELVAAVNEILPKA